MESSEKGTFIYHPKTYIYHQKHSFTQSSDHKKASSHFMYDTN